VEEMKTKLLEFNFEFPESGKAQEVADVLQKGGIAGIPTETVFGLACNGADEKAVERLYDIKNRPGHKPFVVQISDMSQMLPYQAEISPKAYNILERFWPGPLTAILKTKTGKTGFRMPDNRVALAILGETNFPVFVTSANISGRRDCVCARDAFKQFNGLVEIIAEDNQKAQGIASTVLDCTGEAFEILRSGAIDDKLQVFL
jgi:L-threonylcarbamoyladenylate synthase